MSEFDKEAEREKLREKFARDEEKRKSTQRMSELLLKGATMTNKHCDTCGDPIFRYQGQAFCPTCQSDQTAGSAEAARAEATDDEMQAELKSGDDADGSDEVEVTPEPPQSGEPSTARRPSTDESDDPATTQQSAPSSAASVRGRTSTGSASQSQSASGDLSDARAALVRTVTRYATAAENAEDPRRAKELLSAAREAAETLSALNR
ncbi:Sjogren's syndrome/scleroderma autoantigen 1 family protein [Haloprofundus salinisoli]|uniref:Sjogren's syndrome/scleroderma autoantigen 1 family protein n=1 Tax=Haloprofundus salinisoli TaxID=2876193 RepID=UPI001CC99F0A|nr:Sjogren's syndrome/scleroderma autoantigen 1 family protein [Haloprofundus salinisoli]